MTTIFTKVERDAHCTKNYTAGHREGYTCTTEQVHGGEGYTLNVHIAVNRERYRREIHLARPHCGGWKGVHPHAHTADGEDGYILHIQRERYIFLVH